MKPNMLCLFDCLLLGLCTVFPLLAAPVEVTDDFSAYEAGADGGPAWLPQTDTWVMREGGYVQTDPRPYGTVSYLAEPVVGDFELSVRFRIPTTEGAGVQAAGIVFRSASAGKEYWAHFDSKSNQLLLQLAKGGGAGSERPQARVPVQISRDEWHLATVECQGPRITVSLDGRQVVELQDDTYPAGKVGLRAGQGCVQFRDFALKGQSAALPNDWEMIRLTRKYQVICEDAGAGGYEAFPDLVRLQNGELLCVFYAGYGHVSHPTEALPNGARVCMVRSADDGKSWSPAQVVADTPWDDRDPSICQLSDGTIIVNWFTYYHGGPSVRPGNTVGYKEIWLTRSEDNGQTWSEPELIPSTANGYWGCSSPIRELADGTLVLPIYHEYPEPLRNVSYTILSADGGKTWGGPNVVDPDNDDNDEPDIVVLPDGRLLCLMRANRDGNNMHKSVSEDGGKTWSKAQEVGFRGHAPNLLRTAQGILLVGHRLPNTALHYSLDDGETWSDTVHVDDTIGAYTSMAQLPDGRVLIVYYEEGAGSSIRAQYLRATPEGIEFGATDD